jgi:type I restriction enzyme S subunit
MGIAMIFKSTPWPLKMVSSQGQVQAGRQRSPHFVEGKMRCYLRVANVFDGFIDTSDIKQMPFSDKEYEIYKLAQGDILLNEGQSLELVGRPAIYAGKPASCCFQNTLVRFRPGPECDSKYALQLFQLCLQIGVFASIASQTTSIAHLGVKRFSRLKLPFPLKKEQQAIATILSTWDRAIEKTEALIQAKERRKAGLMQRLLTGKVRFGEFGPVADDTPPTDWDTCRLEDICKRVTRKNPDGITHVLTASGEHGLVDQRDYFNRSVAGESLANYYLLKKGEFAYNRSSMNGYPYGAIKRLDRYEAGLLSTLYLCFRITSEKVDSDYLRHFFDSPILNKELRGIVQVGARAHGLLNVSTGDFMRLRVCIPSLKEQKRIAKCLDAATSEIQEHRNQLTALKEQKKGLMQQLLTGKVRVKAKE